MTNSKNFNPRSPYGERPDQNRRILPHHYFNPRSPYGERPYRTVTDKEMVKFQSTLPLRGATGVPGGSVRSIRISIHAPLTGSDLVSRSRFWPFRNFNPRSPYGERRYATHKAIYQKGISIHAPLTGSDYAGYIYPGRRNNFNPRSPYGERPGLSLFFLEVVMISIHAPLTGSD